MEPVKILYDLLNILPLGLTTMLLLAERLNFPEEKAAFYLCALFFLGLPIAVRHMEKRFKWLLPGLLTVITLAAVWMQDPQERIGFLFQWQWLLWMLLVALAAFVLGLLCEKSKVLSRLTLLGLCILGFGLMYFHVPVDKPAAALLLLEALVLLVQEMQRSWEKSGYTDRKGHLVFLLPFMLAATLAVYLLPAGDKPYDWHFVSVLMERAESVTRYVSHFFSSEQFGEIGFAQEGGFQAHIRGSKKELMTVTPHRSAGPLLYLSGKNFDTFDGREWTAEHETGYSRIMDTMETFCGIRTYDVERARNYMWYVPITFEYGQFHTEFVFLPQKPVLQTEKVEGLSYVEYEDSVQGEKKLGYNTRYRIYGYRLNKEHAVFREFIESGTVIGPENWEHCTHMFGLRTTPGYGYEDLLAYREQIRQNYMQEITLSEPLTELLSRITAQAQTDYERLKAIEAYLSSLRYSDDPGKLPDSVQSAEDFLEYFLLEKQEGYCAHFATAFALLARSQGYPARYVQGYYVPVGTEKSVTVTSDMAHAWPEVYLENIGWISFEPTPGRYQENTWVVKEETADSAKDELQENPEDTWVNPFAAQQAQGSEEEEPAQEKKNYWPLILLILACSLAFLAGFLILDVVLFRRWYKTLSEREQLRLLCHRDLAYLQALKLGLCQGETLSEYRERLSSEIPKEALRFLTVYEQLSYRGSFEKEMLREAKECGELLYGVLRGKKGKWAYLTRLRIQRRRY